MFFLLLYGCTVVQDQCTIYTLYYSITSLPVYPNTVHGQCTVVVLDTSIRVYCILLLMDARYSVVHVFISKYIWAVLMCVYILLSFNFVVCMCACVRVCVCACVRVLPSMTTVGYWVL